MRVIALLCISGSLVLVGCGGGGPSAPPEPIEVDYSTFTDTLVTGELTGALSLELVVGGEPEPDVTGRLALAGASENEGYVAVSGASGFWRVGNVPGGDYELFLSGPRVVSEVVLVTVTAGKITTRTIELQPFAE
ncbi:MAG: hypothetical protein GF320_05775 [Armatimonadia bacterium]|nr:hypothetical protein [Armatimonadia bacterium]